MTERDIRPSEPIPIKQFDRITFVSLPDNRDPRYTFLSQLPPPEYSQALSDCDRLVLETPHGLVADGVEWQALITFKMGDKEIRYLDNGPASRIETYGINPNTALVPITHFF